METGQILKIIGIIIFAFLCGAIPTGYLIVKQRIGVDIRKLGSGNIGSTNVRRVAGSKVATLVQLVDILKGVVPTGLALLAGSNASMPIGREVLISMAGIATVLGHNYTPFLRFRGGKGVNTTVGAFLVIFPFSAIMAAASYFISKYTVRIVSISSIILSFVILATVIMFRQPLAYIIAAGAACFLILVNHKSNITRLLKGQEPRI